MTDSASLVAPVATALAALTLALDEPGADLADSVADLADACRLAVPSYAGLSVEATVNGRELGFTTLDDQDSRVQIATSLRLEMKSSPRRTDGVSTIPSIVLILYATTGGAFVDLSADLGWLLTSQAPDIAVDRDLTAPAFQRVDIALAEMSSIDQAIGVLIGHGNTPDQARQQITEMSARSGCSLHTESERLLTSLGLGSGPSQPDELLD